MVVFYDSLTGIFYINLDQFGIDCFLFNSNYNLDVQYIPEKNCCRSFFYFLDKKTAINLYDLIKNFTIKYVVF